MGRAAKSELPSRADGAPLQLTGRIVDAIEMLGIGRSKLYESTSNGELETIELGTATLIIVDSIYSMIGARGQRHSPACSLDLIVPCWNKGGLVVHNHQMSTPRVAVCALSS